MFLNEDLFRGRQSSSLKLYITTGQALSSSNSPLGERESEESECEESENEESESEDGDESEF